METQIQRAAANVRMPADMKRALRIQAAMNDRSFNEEVVQRLSQTMRAEDSPQTKSASVAAV